MQKQHHKIQSKHEAHTKHGAHTKTQKTLHETSNTQIMKHTQKVPNTISDGTEVTLESCNICVNNDIR